MWIILLLLLSACDSRRQDFCVESVHGIRTQKVIALLNRFENKNSAKKISVQYEIIPSIGLIDRNGQTNFQDLLIKICINSDCTTKQAIMHYQHYGYDCWQYNDAVFDAIAQKIVELENES